MSVDYQPITWNAQKKKYDLLMLGLIVLYVIAFVSITLHFHPNTTLETLIIRTTGTLAFTLLQIILCIGPLSRLNKHFMPLLYNRRHLGVTMFFISCVHGIFSLIQFHTLGNLFFLDSLFLSNLNYFSIADFPFQVLGFFALLILSVMAFTSHDFWNKNLGAFFWKSLHMMVYFAYFLLLLHLLLGAYQQDHNTYLITYIGIGFITISSLHLISTIKEINHDRDSSKNLGKINEEGFRFACKVSEIKTDCAKVIQIGEERIALFKYDKKIVGVSNVCEHQNGPLGEGKIIDGCITCPWHGYQYNPENGQAPPPFKEKIHTYKVLVFQRNIFVNPNPLPKGTPITPACY